MNPNIEEPRTIVEYAATKPAYNGYPERIVSPPLPKGCCLEEMMAIGNLHWENNMPFVYRQCRVCDHTVRHFLDDAFDVD